MVAGATGLRGGSFSSPPNVVCIRFVQLEIISFVFRASESIELRNRSNELRHMLWTLS